MSDATAPTITATQYRAAIDALGLDPDLVSSVTLSGQWVQIAQIATDDAGAPRVVLGQTVIVRTDGAIIDDTAEAADE